MVFTKTQKKKLRTKILELHKWLLEQGINDYTLFYENSGEGDALLDFIAHDKLDLVTWVKDGTKVTGMRDREFE